MADRNELTDTASLVPEVNAPRLSSTVAWFCLRSQPKRELLVEKHLEKVDGVSVFNPRIQYPRSTRTGKSIITESMFPNYLFARFDWKTLLNRVHYALGVGGVVRFGDKWPTVPEQAISEIRAVLGEKGVHVISDKVTCGDEVEVSGGLFHGLHAIVSQVMPGQERVMLLMDFLGRQTAVQVGIDSVVRAGFGR